MKLLNPADAYILATSLASNRFEPAVVKDLFIKEQA
ncbi:hypothetical protein SVI_0918 [Shewanella violacea DSS12]|uniref:Uncharacterized protein n=1 Tax=Shewanella violacea (strain JCM 10179 / CIP 106290 / LMG 19151 / DSS12) TaxID=637905 RepID=D4ZGU0_SHEVD|nr:hypothetical protein SVI_0918 [Shewanella violacea DSS12]